MLGLSLTAPLLAFGGGIGAAGVAFGTRYFTQHFFHIDNEKVENGLLITSVAFGLGAFVAFGFGVLARIKHSRPISICSLDSAWRPTE